jgi:diguanylate cyclase (GGDEF)-like protein
VLIHGDKALITKFAKLFSFQADKPDLVVAQVKAFSRQVPLLYFVLVANIGFVAATHFSVAPIWLTVGVPSLFTLIAVLRMIGWLKARHIQYTPEAATKRLKSTIILVIVLGVMMTAWSLALLLYGHDFQRGHVGFFMSATLVACTFCLMHLRAAAMLMSIVVAVPFCLVFGLQGNAILTAIAANMALVTCAMMYVLSNHHDDFATMVEQRADLIRVNEKTQLLNAENHKLANLDALTGLANRRSFIKAINDQIELSKEAGTVFAVGLIDLDGFKGVNDLYGHAAGDALLLAASQRLQSLAGIDLQFARLGGDEFGFIIKNTNRLTDLGGHICQVLAQGYSYENITLQISASCGVALYPESCDSTSRLLEYADYALYQAKQHHTGEALIFTASHRDQLHRTHQVDQALRHADLNTELQLHFQPVIEKSTRAIVAFEALARWNSPVLGLVPPVQFIATAEHSQLIHKVTQTLLQRLLDDIKTLPNDMRVCFNLSAKSLASPQAMLKILATVQASGVDPKRLTFEVTETALIANFEVAMSALQLLRNMGASIALDDFGTGYSSLSYVHQLPLDVIKIDRQFVTDVCTDSRAQKVVKSIVGLSRDLGVKCVAEGVETEEQAEILTVLGCSLMQGYHFAMPMPLAEARNLLRPEQAILQGTA